MRNISFQQYCLFFSFELAYTNRRLFYSKVSRAMTTNEVNPDRSNADTKHTHETKTKNTRAHQYSYAEIAGASERASESAITSVG